MENLVIGVWLGYLVRIWKTCGTLPSIDLTATTDASISRNLNLIDFNIF